MRHTKVAIIGAGTAGLSARREVAKMTDDYVVIDDGPLGTTCARVGCMPSKVLVQVANDYHRRHAFAEQGIVGAAALSVDTAATMRHVRSLRDRFVRGVMRGIEAWTATHLIRKRARFIDRHTLDLGDEQLRADQIIIATGSAPVIPDAWRPFAHRLIDSNTIFELPELPRRVAVIGLGVIGLELGQALHRLGVEVTAVTLDKAYGGLTDPELQEVAHGVFDAEMDIRITRVNELSERGDDLLITLANGETLAVDAAVVAMGRRPNLGSLGIEQLGIPTTRGIPDFALNTFRVADAPWLIAGDVNGTRPVLHEAADDGRIAGYNAVRDSDQCFRPRTGLAITFSSPNIAVVGRSHRELTADGVDFVTGRVSYEGQGRAIVMLAERGALHVYAERETGALLGGELIAPSGEHLAHLLAWAIAADLTVRQSLSLPFYHPVVEEGLRTALRNAARQVNAERPPLDVLRCADPPVGIRA